MIDEVIQMPIGNRNNTCPETFNNELKQNWDCAEYFKFNDYQASYQLIGLLSKIYQLIIFTLLALVLCYRRYEKDGLPTSRFPLMITSFALLDGIFTLARVCSIFPFMMDQTANLGLFAIYQGIGNFFFLGAFFLFGLKYHETANLIKIMLDKDLDALGESNIG